jgi:KDO2-lipid IV(A) lauroyltransferase
LEQATVDKLNDSIARRGRLRTCAEYALAWTILKTLGLLPRSFALRAGKAVGAIAHAVLPHLGRHAEINLRLAMPELSADDRRRIRHGVFANLGRLLGEVSQFPRLHPENISRVVVYEGLDNFQAAQAAGRGVLLLTGHIGAWELSVFSHSIYGHPMSFLARRVDNPLVERLAEGYRSRYGNRSIDKRGSVREVLRTLKLGGVVGVLADLNATREEGVFVDFFGLPACTTAGLATLALRTGAVVLPGYLIWDSEARIHRLHFEPPIETINTGNQKADTIENTARYTKALEAIIRRHPDQWLWIHRRWRTRPEGEASFY